MFDNDPAVNCSVQYFTLQCTVRCPVQCSGCTLSPSQVGWAPLLPNLLPNCKHEPPPAPPPLGQIPQLPRCHHHPPQAGVSCLSRIAEYLPGSDVTQHARLDLDQVIQASLSSELEIRCSVRPRLRFTFFLAERLSSFPEDQQLH